MKLFDKHQATALRELFAGMDAADEAGAASAMTKAAALLRKHDLSFRHIVQDIKARNLLLPSKVGAAIQLMDSTTLSEAESAFAGARRLMKSCGLTFAGVIAALDREPAKTEDIEELRLAYKIEAERCREMEVELQYLRATAGGPVAEIEPPASSPLKNLVVAATLVFGVVLAVSIVSTFADLSRSANATATPHSSAAAQTQNLDFISPSSAGWSCWRNRSTRGSCF